MTVPHREVIHDRLFGWWRSNGRILPWREKLSAQPTLAQQERNLPAPNQDLLREATFSSYFASSQQRDPYRVVVAELMLQQTQVDRVFPKYMAWMKQWPQITDLAKATLAEVLIFWQGLGYNRRARFLWLLAQEISIKRQGVWPTTELELLTLPGIGKYTARAIQSFAFGQQVGVVDTNVKRIFERLYGAAKRSLADGRRAATALPDKAYFELADQILPQEQADPWNQALMDFGALICTARAPKCSLCPVQDLCVVNIKARELGYINFAECQKAELLQKPSSSLAKPKFETTDRYFRGRLIDELRGGTTTVLELKKRFQNNYGLSEEARFNKLVASLAQEGLIRIENGQVQIG